MNSRFAAGVFVTVRPTLLGPLVCDRRRRHTVTAVWPYRRKALGRQLTRADEAANAPYIVGRATGSAVVWRASDRRLFSEVSRLSIRPRTRQMQRAKRGSGMYLDGMRINRLLTSEGE